ncbi:phage minor tail protein L [Salipiger pacificus]|nr:phage minor tail protein L [Alloyangia pacifica]
MSDAIANAIQQPAPGDLVVLFIVDLSFIGQGVFRFTESVLDGEKVRWNGQVFEPVDIEAEGFEWAATGQAPQPMVRISNVKNPIFSAVALSNDDLLGATVIRIRTFRQFLDGQAEADPEAIFPPQIFKIERKSQFTKSMIEFELATPLDQEGRKLPARQCLRDTCTHRYRRWTGSGFDYSKATCPFAGTVYLDSLQNPVAASADRCGKKLSDCRLRFGNNAPLPYRGFPGMNKYRT